jgi:hypothetical protein
MIYDMIATAASSQQASWKLDTLKTIWALGVSQQPALLSQQPQ